MSSPEERIQSMQRSGVVEAGQAQALLGAIGPAREPAWKILVDPFARHGGGRAAAAGLVISLAGIAASRLGLRFDGFLDAHLTGVTPTWGRALTDQIVAFPLSALVFWACARIAGGRGRLLDNLGVVGVGRLPVLLVGLCAWSTMPSSLAGLTGVRLFVLVIPALLALGWAIVLLRAGHANASGLRGLRLGLSLFAAIVAAEVLSKVALSLLS
jgi:hypothetical protein